MFSQPFHSVFYLLSPVIIGIITTGLAIYVLPTVRKARANRLFLFLLLGMGLWDLFIFGMRRSATLESALIWDRLLILPAYAVWLFFYHFSLVYTKNRGQRGVLRVAYIIAFAIMVLAPTRFLIPNMTIEWYGYAPATTSLCILFFSIGIVLIGLSVFNLIKRYRLSLVAEERNRLLYLIVASVFPVIGAGLDGFSNLPPAAIWANLLFCVICSFAIFKYNLLDIHYALRKGITYAIISALIALPYVGTIYLLSSLPGIQKQSLVIHLALIFVVAILLRPLYNFTQRLVDKMFYKEKYDALKVFHQFSKQTQSIINVKSLEERLVLLISKAFDIENVTLMLRTEDNRKFDFKASTNLSCISKKMQLTEGNSLIKWLSEKGKFLYIHQLDYIPQLQSLSSSEKEIINSTRASIVIPLVAREGEMIGLLFIGAKRKGQPFTSEDIREVSNFVGQVGTVFENALLYTHTLNARRDLESWLNSMKDCVLIIDQDNTVKFFNDSALQNFNVVLGDKCRDILGFNIIGMNITDISLVKNESVGKIIETSEKKYELTTAPIRNPDYSSSLLVILRDITDVIRMEAEKKEIEKKAEEERRKLEWKAQQASRLASVGEMASGIAHEINNPLTGVVGFSKILVDRGGWPEEVQEQLEVINSGATRVADIVKRMLTFARQQKPERKLANINEAIETCLALRKYEMETGNIKLIRHLDPELPLTVVDAGQLQDVFMNIIVNAEKAMRQAHEGGNLNIRTETVGDIIRISITDDGPGIAAKNMDKIFNPFFTTRKVGEGTGLGLSLSYGIIQEHHGKIYAESELGKGATFIVELPINAVEEGEESPVKPVEEVKTTTRAKILVIDDEPTILAFLREFLVSEGHEVEMVDNCRDALERTRANRYGLILCDVLMPEMSGAQFYYTVMEEIPSLARRFIFMTGDVIGAETRHFLSEAGRPYVTKPFNLVEVKKVISQMLSGS